MTQLRTLETAPPQGFTKEDCIEKLEGFHDRLFDLQNVFYADGRNSLLIVFQGVDTAGKDSTIRHVMNSMNPMGVNVKPFKLPTAEEASHDFYGVYTRISLPVV